jgi:Flp pilus assembly protein TadD
VLHGLGRAEEALTSCNRALAIQPNFPEAWFNRGRALDDLGRYEEALTSYDQALAIQPNFPEAWNNRGSVLFNLERYEEALTSFDQVLTIQLNDHRAWSNRGNALSQLGHYEEALASFDQALTIQLNDHDAWSKRGTVLSSLRRYEEAIASFDHALQLTDNQYWQAWVCRGGAIYKLRGYKAALQNWDEALHSLQSNTLEYREGCGVLHQFKGDAHYQHGKLQENPFPYWRYAYGSYQQALKFLRTLNLRQRRLEVLQDLIKVSRALGKTKEAQALLEQGTDLLGRLLQETPFDADKIWLSQKFASIAQLRVDELVQLGNWCAALELAEQRKNLCLTWLHYGWSESAEDSPNYAQMQELLQPSPTGKDGEKAIVYWHISPAAISTFILRYKQPPLVLSAKADLTPPAPLPYKGMGESDSPLLAGEGQGERFFYPPSLRQLVEFENWIETWKRIIKNIAKERDSETKKTDWKKRKRLFLLLNKNAGEKKCQSG